MVLHDPDPFPRGELSHVGQHNIFWIFECTFYPKIIKRGVTYVSHLIVVAIVGQRHLRPNK